MDGNGILTLIIAVFASTGFWAFITALIQRKDSAKNNRDKLLLGLAYDRICYLAGQYIIRGWLTKDEFESLHDYLFVPYKSLGGDGTADKFMDDVRKLPIRPRKEVEIHDD